METKDEWMSKWLQFVQHSFVKIETHHKVYGFDAYCIHTFKECHTIVRKIQTLGISFPTSSENTLLLEQCENRLESYRLLYNMPVEPLYSAISRKMYIDDSKQERVKNKSCWRIFSCFRSDNRVN